MLTARPEVDRGRGVERLDDDVRPAAVSTSGCSTWVPLKTFGNVRRNSVRDTGPTTHTSSRPSCTLAAGVIIMPLA